MGSSLTPARWLRLFTRLSVLILCLWFFVVEIVRCVRLRFSKSSEVSCWAILAIVFLSVSYCFVVVRTKHLCSPVPRYIYFGSLSLMALLVNGSFHPYITKFFKRGVLLLSIMAIFVSAYEDVVSRFANRSSRECLDAVVKELSALGVDHVYSEYWTSFSLAAASRGKVSSVAIVYDRKKDRFVHRWVSFLDATYDRECHAYVRPMRKSSSKMASPEENLHAALKAFGPPSRIVQVGRDYEIMFYDKNIAFGAPLLPAKNK